MGKIKKRSWEKKLLAMLLVTITIAVSIPVPIFTHAAGNFVPRTTDPGNNSYYTENPYSKYGPKNCTYYAWGRAHELLGYKPPLFGISGQNAKSWWDQPGGFEKGNEPRLGAIMCWGGTTYGHVAVVERIDGNKITFSDASCPYEWNGKENPGWAFRIRENVEISQLSNIYLGTFQGYIYLPGIGVDSVPSIPKGSPIPGGGRPISDGDYHIVSALEGDRFNPGQKCLTIGGLPVCKNDNCANAELWSVMGFSDHVFTVTCQGDGTYKIKLKDSDNKCLDVYGGGLERGTTVHQYEDNGTEAQRWVIDETDDGVGYTIRSKLNGWYVDVDGGQTDNATNIHLWEGNGTKSQIWYFIPWGGGSSVKQELPDGEYEIVPRLDNNKSIQAKTGNIELNTRNNKEAQTFQTTYLGNGYYKILYGNSNSSFDVTNAGSKNGTNVGLYVYRGTCNQEWIIRSCGDGYFNIISKCNGLYLDLAGANTDNGTNIQLCVGWGYNGGDAQQWRFIPAKSVPEISVFPSASEITYGQTLADSVLSGGTANTSGSFSWKDNTILPTCADSETTSYTVVFTPSNTEDWQPVEMEITVKVNPAQNAPDMPGTVMYAAYEKQTVEEIPLPDGWAWADTDKNIKLEVDTTVTATAFYTGDGKGNYVNEQVRISLIKSKCSHPEDKREIRNALAASCEQNGYTGDIYCTNCQTVIETGNVTASLGHDYEVRITKEPTAKEKGEKIYICNRCNDSYTEEIPRQGWGDLTEEDQELYEQPDDIPDGFWIVGIPDNTDYTGKAITFNIRVYDNKRLLTNKTDYTVSYKNNTNAADKTQVPASKAPAVTVTGKGNYSGTVVTYFTINPIDISTESAYADEFSAEDVLRAYTGKVQKAASVLKRNGKALRNGKDYVISYNAADEKAYQDAGTYKVTITGKGNYTGERIYYETITAETLMSKVSVAAIKNQKYTGSEIVPALNVTYNKKALVGMEASEYENLLVTSETSKTDLLAVDYTYVFTDNKEIGTASVTLTGMNKYAGTVTKTFKITGTALKDCSLTGFQKTFAYTGSEIMQDVSFRYSSGKGNSKVIHDLAGMSAAEFERADADTRADIDFTYEYLNNTEVGTATVIYTGVNGYTGVIKKDYKITGISMKDVKVNYFRSSLGYTGEKLKQELVQLSYQTGKGANQVSVTLKENRDYVVTYQNNVKAGTATVSYKGIGKYTGTIKKTYKITVYNLKDDFDNRIEVTYASSIAYAKGGAMPVPVVTYKYNGKSRVLTAGTDYTVSYTNHKAASENSAKTPCIYIQGKGNFTGKFQAGSFTITKQKLEQLVITVPDITYKNKANIYKAVPVITDLDGKKLVSGTDYNRNFVYEYAEDTKITQIKNKKSVDIIRREGEIVNSSDIIPSGAQIRITVTGKNNYEGTISAVFRFVEGNLSSASVSVAAQYYTGNVVEPGKEQITVKLGKIILSEADYEITGYSNNIKKGTAKITLHGIGNYSGTKTVNFKILDRTMGCLIKFNGNGSTSGTMGNQVIVSNIIGKTLTGNQYKKTGYRFTGWNTEKDGSGTNYNNKEKFSNGFQKYGISVTLYAQWEPEKYGITYVLNGGANSPENPDNYTVESDTVELKSPIREGYSFEGWYLDNQYKKKISEIPGGSTGNKKLFAKWKKI